MDMIPYGKYPVLHRIDTVCGPLQNYTYYSGERSRRAKAKKRTKMEYGYYRKYALRVLSELSGFTEADRLWAGILDPRKQWVLRRLESSPYQYSFQENSEVAFLQALAKDAGVWPPPKWWRVMRRLNAATQHSS